MHPADPEAQRTARVPASDRGAVLIEFALVFPILLVLTLTVVDVSRAFFVKNMLHQAAREGVRTLVVSSPDSARVRASEIMVAANIPVTSITCLGPANRQMGVRVESQYTWLYPGLFKLVGANLPSPLTLKAEAWMRKETP